MGFVTTQLGEQFILRAFVFADIFKLHLYTNDWTPSLTDTILQYTDVNYAGYSPKILSPTSWIIAIDNLTGSYVATFPQQTFTFSASITIYGYYITDDAEDKLLIAERFSNAPITLGVSGGNIKITPAIGIR